MRLSIGNSSLWGVFLLTALMFASTPTLAGTVTYENDFSSGIGAATLLDDAVLDNGSVLLTDAVNDQQGALVIDDLVPFQQISSWTATFDLLAGPGSVPPADGISFTFGNQPDSSYGEEGMWRLLTISFDTFDNGDPDHIGIDVRWHNNPLATSTVDPYTDGQFVPVSVTYDADGTLDVIFNGVPVFTDLQTGYNRKAGDSFGFGGRTGAANSVQRIDNVVISVTPDVVIVPMLNRYSIGLLMLLILGAGFIGYRRLV